MIITAARLVKVGLRQRHLKIIFVNYRRLKRWWHRVCWRAMILASRNLPDVPAAQHATVNIISPNFHVSGGIISEFFCAQHWPSHSPFLSLVMRCDTRVCLGHFLSVMPMRQHVQSESGGCDVIHVWNIVQWEWRQHKTFMTSQCSSCQAILP